MFQSGFFFNEDHFNRLFPFYLLLNRRMEVTAYGSSLKKMELVQPSCSFHDYLFCKRPRFEQPDFSTIAGIAGQLVMVQSKVNNKIILRGQWELLDKDHIIFLGSPWFHSVEEVIKNRLSLNDFANYDPTIDLLHVLKTQELVSGDLQAMQQALTLNSKRFTSLVKNLHTAILIIDEKDRIVETNEQFCSLFGISTPPNLLKGAAYTTLKESLKAAFVDPEQFEQQVHDLVQENRSVQHQQLSMRDGRVLKRDFIPLYDQDRSIGHLWQYQDVTEATKAEAKLRQREEKYRSIIANMNLGLLEVDNEDRIMFANQSFAEMSGFAVEEMLGKKAAELLFRAEQRQIFRDKSELRAKGISDVYEINLINRKGAEIWWMISGAPLYNDAGERIGSIGIHLDITAQKQLTQELLQAKVQAETSVNTKQQFLANMSHEIRTPMNAILGISRQLQKKITDKEQLSLVDAVTEASENLLVILNDILDFSKLDAGKLSLEEIPFSLVHSIQKTTLLLGYKAEEKNLYLYESYDPGIAPVLKGDPFRLNQVLLNLLGNAIKFTETGGITLQCSVVANEKHKQVVQFTIADSGIGINADYLPHIFEKFTQQDQHTSRKFGGSGLGMSICKQLVELMGGTLAIESEQGRGTTLQVIIPFAKTDAALPAKPISSVEQQGHVLSGKKVLVVDDNTMNRMVAGLFLNPHGIMVQEAVNGAEAIQLLKEHSFDLVLMDVQMPVMNGMEATRIIREKISATIPVIALTANAIKSEGEQFLLAGMNAILTKPFQEQEILSILLHYLSNTGAPETQKVNSGTALNLESFRLISEGQPEMFLTLITALQSELKQAAADLSNQELLDNDLVRRVIHHIMPNVEMLEATTLIGMLEALREHAEGEIKAAQVDAVCTEINRLVAQLEQIQPVP